MYLAKQETMFYEKGLPRSCLFRSSIIWGGVANIRIMHIISHKKTIDFKGACIINIIIEDVKSKIFFHLYYLH